MRTKSIENRLFLLLIISSFAFSCAKKQEATKTTQTPLVKADSIQAKITFIELGSVKCVPCRQMQPVMKAIEEKFTGQVKVIFYDVWQKDQNHFAYDYHINLIPTQVFLDAQGNEIFRHEGFFPEEEITKFLKKQGLQPMQSGAL